MEENEPVIIQAILLSDQVVREAGTNKLTLVGLFTVWNALSFPFTAPPFFITPLIVNFRKGGTIIPVTFRIEQVTGHVLWSLEAKVGFPDGQIPPHAIFDAPVPVVGLTFKEPGRYTIRVIVDSEEIGKRDFYVIPVTSGPTQQLR